MQLYFDECCSKRFKDDLRAFFAEDFPDLRVSHVLDHYNPGTGDSTWLKPLEDKSVIVITADIGRDPSKEKLPLICKKLGVTHIVFSSTLINAGYTKQKSAIAAVWQQIVEQVPRLPRGTKVKLGLRSIRGGDERFELRIGHRSLSAMLSGK
jgi:PIN like domain